MKDVVLGPWGWLIVVAVLASVLSSTQTTILPTARGTLSMGVHGALPPKFGEVHPRNQTPGFSTQVMGAAAVVLLRGHELPQREPAVRFHQRHQPVHRLLLRADRLRLRLVLPRHPPRVRPATCGSGASCPLLGALLLTAAFFVSAVQMWDPAYGDTQIFGVGGAFVSGVVLLALGVVLAVVCRFLPSTRGYFLAAAGPAGTPRRDGRRMLQ